MIYKFDQFNEKYSVKSRAQVLGMSKEMALKSYAPWYDWENCETKMYRAVKGSRTKPDKVKIIDPSKFNRKALGKPPFYNLLLSNWEGYPDRSKSVICSTERKKLEIFGSLIYRIIPMEENSKVAFAPTTDIWASFNDYCWNKVKEYRLNLKHNPSDFGEDISRYFFPEYKGKNLQNITLDEFRNRVKAKEKSKLTVRSWTNEVNFFGTVGDVKEYEKERFFRDFEGIWEFFVDAYNPEYNGFELMEYNNTSIPKKLEGNLGPSQGIECWTDAPCLMIYEGFS